MQSSLSNLSRRDQNHLLTRLKQNVLQDHRNLAFLQGIAVLCMAFDVHTAEFTEPFFGDADGLPHKVSEDAQSQQPHFSPEKAGLQIRGPGDCFLCTLIIPVACLEATR